MFYITRDIKIMMDIFGLQHKEIEDSLTNWKRKKLLKG
jgi:hypothetical protein